MATDWTYDVFLSHAFLDTEAVAELARRLEGAGLKPYFPEQRVRGGGDCWELEVEEGLNQSQTLAVFCGPRGLDEIKTREIARWVEDKGYRGIIPVLLPGALSSELPSFLRMQKWVNFRNGLDDAEAFQLLIIAIRDGGLFGQSLFELAEASRVAFRIFKDRLPVHRTTEIVANFLDIDSEGILFGIGLDLELLGTFDGTISLDKASKAMGLYNIGEVISIGRNKLVGLDGTEKEIPATGWEHFSGNALEIAGRPLLNKR